MNKKLAIASAMLALGLGSTAAQAQQGPNGAALEGSDTLFQVTQDMLNPMLNLCPGAQSLSYLGGGSGNGENAMLATPATKNAWIAPMSRPLKVGATTCPASAQGVVVGLDGIAVVRDDNSTVQCNTAAFQRTITLDDGSSYTFGDFRDVLRIVYSGLDHTSQPSIAACFTGEPSRSAIGAQNCNSVVRQSIVNHWGNLFQDATCAAGETCTALKHAFRRGDASGTTDTFLTILALPKISATSKPFCNGKDLEDNDPIRRSCTGTGSGTSGGEQVCQARQATALAYPASNTTPLGPPSTPWEPAVNNTGDLGVVLDINVPEGVPTAVSHNVNACNFGAFDLVHMPSAFQLAGTRCPNGTPQVLLKCLYPKDLSGNYGCLNSSVNVPTIGELKKIDGRVYNLYLRTGNNPDDNIVKDKNNVLMTGSYYRLHETKVMPGSGGVPCTWADSTAQIGCLVQASPCSIGFAGREAADDPTIGNNDVRSLLIGTADNVLAIPPTDANVQQLLASCGGVPDVAQRYPLARKLFLNSIVGFSDARIPVDQQALAACEQDRSKTDQAIDLEHFIKLPQPAGLSVADCAHAVSAADKALCVNAPVSQPCL
ncbi:MAG TPA: hypothetical protein VF331_14465 [Polyangiales bacterium]